jgi:carbamoyl-phosphate synthase large subunit
MVELATKIMLGATLKELGYPTGLYPEGNYVAVKVPVFSFAKLQDVDTQLGPEMKSTGEVLGIAHTFEDALYKGLIAAGFRLYRRREEAPIKYGNIVEVKGKRRREQRSSDETPLDFGVLITVRDSDKPEILDVAERFEKLGFKIYATSGTASLLNRNMIAANFTYTITEKKEPNILSLLESGKIQYVISTSETGRKPALDSVRIRRKSVERSIACLTSVDTAKALLRCLELKKSIDEVEMVDITSI